MTLAHIKTPRYQTDFVRIFYLVTLEAFSYFHPNKPCISLHSFRETPKGNGRLDSVSHTENIEKKQAIKKLEKLR